jgi:hypothetical protein
VKLLVVNVSEVPVAPAVSVRVVVNVADPVVVIRSDSFEPSGVFKVALMIAPGVPAARAAGLPDTFVKVTVDGVEPVAKVNDAERSLAVAE